jgi:hypothetical protein
VVTRRTPRSGTTAKRTTAERTTAERTTAKRSPSSRTTRRRTTKGTGGYRTRRRTPRTATTLGSAFALGLVAVFSRMSWPLKIGLVVVVLVAAAGYLVLRARQGAAEPTPESDQPAAVPPAESAPPDAKDAQP